MTIVAQFLGSVERGCRRNPSNVLDMDPSVRYNIRIDGREAPHRISRYFFAIAVCSLLGSAHLGIMSFVHLHTHSNYSLLTGASRFEDLLDKAKGCGMSALALTDIDGLYGAIPF